MASIRIKQGTPAQRAYAWVPWILVAIVLIYPLFAYRERRPGVGLDRPGVPGHPAQRR